jgi:hypothetical protein
MTNRMNFVITLKNLSDHGPYIIFKSLCSKLNQLFNLFVKEKVIKKFFFFFCSAAFFSAKKALTKSIVSNLNSIILFYRLIRRQNNSDKMALHVKKNFIMIIILIKLLQATFSYKSFIILLRKVICPYIYYTHLISVFQCEKKK